MTTVLQHAACLLPVTALNTARNLIFAGEGPLLKIYRFDCNRPGTDAKELASIRVFDTEAVHGVIVHAHGSAHDQSALRLLVWGGRVAIGIAFEFDDDGGDGLGAGVALNGSIAVLERSNELDVGDWILSAAFEPSTENARDDGSSGHPAFCRAMAVTAHGSLHLIHANDDNKRHTSPDGGPTSSKSHGANFIITSTKLTSGSRTILYSAFLVWPTHRRAIVACGTAFGEVLVWSYNCDGSSPREISHYIFQAHEGSVFGVHMSDPFKLVTQASHVRLLASCSDDRTIRVWNIGDVDCAADTSVPSGKPELITSRLTGFNVSPSSKLPETSEHERCMATAMGHESRIWSVRFVYMAKASDGSNTIARLISCGEDATCQLWDLVTVTADEGRDGASALRLRNSGVLSSHAGKNIWSSLCHDGVCGSLPCVVTGGADGSILLTALPSRTTDTADRSYSREQSWEVAEVYGSRHSSEIRNKNDRFCSFAFLDSGRLITTTAGGAILVFDCDVTGEGEYHMISSQSVPELQEPSTITTVSPRRVAFVSGGQGHLYAITANGECINVCHLCSFGNRVLNAFHVNKPLSVASYDSESTIWLVVTFVNHVAPRLISVVQAGLQKYNISFDEPIVSNAIDTSTLVITSAVDVRMDCKHILFLGCRNGTIVVLAMNQGLDKQSLKQYTTCTLLAELHRCHGRDAVTAMHWLVDPALDSIRGHLFSVGRDGSLAIHDTCIGRQGQLSCMPVHQLTIPAGPTLEKLYVDESTGALIVCGFRSTNFKLYNVTESKEIMKINCGGAHRIWAFAPFPGSDPDGRVRGERFAWTKAGKAHVYSCTTPTVTTIRSGGHGRDIKACAITLQPLTDAPIGTLIATGAEDTNIRLFIYDPRAPSDNFRCVAILRKHRTGIQALQWSRDGRFLFSSGGFEEFFVWRVTSVPCLRVGVVLDSAGPIETEKSELRITDFAITELERGDGDGDTPRVFFISLVYSNSIITIRKYVSMNPKPEWTLLGQASYTTSCLTQAAHIMLGQTLYLVSASTDGCVAIWSLDSCKAIHRDRAAGPNVCKIVRLHQSAIKTLSTTAIGAQRTLLVTGGDDGGLGLTILHSDVGNEPMESASLLVPRAHAASVTACCILEDSNECPFNDGKFVFTRRVLTSSTDQRVKAWKVTIDTTSPAAHGIGIEKDGTWPTAVADVSVIVPLRSRGEPSKALVVGVGMEMFCVTDGVIEE